MIDKIVGHAKASLLGDAHESERERVVGEDHGGDFERRLEKGLRERAAGLDFPTVAGKHGLRVEANAARAKRLAQSAQPVLRVERVLRSAGEGDARMPQVRQMIGRQRAGRDVVTAHELHVVDGFVRARRRRSAVGRQPPRAASDRSRRWLFAMMSPSTRWPRIHSRTTRGSYSPRSSRLDSIRLRSRMRELFLDAGQQLDEPGILARVDGDADAAAPAETEVARGRGPGIAERLDDLSRAGPGPAN